MVVGDQKGRRHHQHLKVPPRHFVSNIRHQHRCNQLTVFLQKVNGLLVNVLLIVVRKWAVHFHLGPFSPVLSLYCHILRQYNLSNMGFKIDAYSKQQTQVWSEYYIQNLYVTLNVLSLVLRIQCLMNCIYFDSR